MNSIQGTYDYRLVALSLLIAIATSYTAMDLAGQPRQILGTRLSPSPHASRYRICKVTLPLITIEPCIVQIGVTVGAKWIAGQSSERSTGFHQLRSRSEWPRAREHENPLGMP